MDPSARFDWARAFEILDAMTAVESAPMFGPCVLESLSVAVECDIGSYNEIDPVTQRAVYHVHPGEEMPISPDADRDAFPRLVLQNPILRFQRATGDASAKRISDFITRIELHQLELYQKVYRYLGVEFQVALGLVTKEPLVVAIALSRRERDFDDEDVTLLNVLRPYLVEIYRNVQDLSELEHPPALSPGDCRGVIYLDPQGYRAECSSLTLELLTRHFGAPRSPSGLPDVVNAWVVVQRVRRLEDGRPRLHLPLVSVVDDREAVARFIAGTENRPDVVIVDERALVRGAADLLPLGLTGREAELLFLLIQGTSTFAISQRLRVSTGTVNKHLQHIYRKLGVSNRTAATAAGSDALYSRS
jgi:DNA-binding CsgD family transcriptional regulator